MGTQGFGSPALPPLGFYLPPFLERGLGHRGFTPWAHRAFTGQYQ